MKHARSRVFTNLVKPLPSKRSLRVITFGVCFALLLSSVSSLWSTTVTAKDYTPVKKTRAQQNGSPNPQDRRVAPLPPRSHPPAANLPNLDELRASGASSRQSHSFEPPRPVPSTMRSRRKARWLTPENRAVSGLTPRTPPFARQAETQVRAHHARAKSHSSRLVTSPQTPPPPGTRINYALASNGGAATVSSTLPSDSGGSGTYWSASALNNGDRKGTNWGYGGGWADASSGSFPDWVQIDFSAARSVDEIDLFTIQDNFSNPSEPTTTTTFSAYGVTGYDVQYWNGSSWVGVPGGTISGNNNVWRQITFSAVITSKIRVNISSVIDNGYSRMTEVEAWGDAVTMNVAAASNGGVATASSTLNSSFPASGVINSDRKGLNWGNGGGWADQSSGTFPDWVQIDFSGSKSISEIDLFTLQDDYSSPAEPTETMTFSTHGVSAYNVEYWNGTGWTALSEGQISGNDKVWRKITFSPITTSKIRVQTTAAIDNGYSRLTEIEAWGIGTNGGDSLSDFAMARLNPANRTGTGGEDLLSNNVNWNLPLVSLPGRSGLDLGLTLSYNSLVWIRAGSSINFDLDQGSIAPGFRLGFPVIEGPYWNNQANANFYLLITPSGGRVELRQVGSSIYYESVDSSHLRLTDNISLDFSLLLQATDGSQLRFEAADGWRCKKITDRNGNYINVTYKSWGELETVTDTLGRVLTFHYDGNDNLQSITQSWGGQTPPHEWATFGWSTATIGNNFSGLNNQGPNSTTIPVLRHVGLPDGSRYTFDYPANGYGIVSTIRYDAKDSGNVYHERHHTTYTYSTTGASSDGVPRVTERKVAAEYWTGLNGVPSEVVTQFGHDADGACRMTLPDGTVHKEYYGSSWQSGLTTETRTYATVADANSNVWQKKTTTAWTQDSPNLTYLTNPRVLQVDVEDTSGNHRRTTIDYGAVNLGYVQWGLPHIVREYGVNGTTATEFRRSQTDYHLTQPYLDSRIIGLVSSSQLYDAVANQWLSKTTYEYDWGGEYFAVPSPDAIQHDGTKYGGGLIAGRGNLSAVRRWDVTDIDNEAKAVWVSRTAHNSLGAPYFTRDALGHQTTLSYLDSFSADGINLDPPRSFATYAYPTAITDADGFSSTARYRYDFGAKTRVQGPPPENQQNGVIQTFTYDSAARLERVTTANTGAYTHYEYGRNYVSTFTTVNNIAADYHLADLYATQIFDGVGRVIAAARNHPGSDGGYSAVVTVFDRMGRAIAQSNPTETRASGSPWEATGDDDPENGGNGWVYTQQTYDWMGRPRLTINPSITGNPNETTYKEASYDGCGCAGGEVVTLTDEGTLVDIDPGPGVNNVTRKRQQKIYSDVLGRAWKTEVLNWDGAGAFGTGGSVYSTTVSVYNARDQVLIANQYSGSAPAESSSTNAEVSCPTGTCQRTTMGFDGYGRLQSKHVPEQNAGTATAYAYNADDTILSVTDARGSSSVYTYSNNRHLVSSITYEPAENVPDTPDVSFAYDAAGNRRWMTDGSGRVDYVYDSLSRLHSETRQFTGLAGSFALNYEYNVAGQLKKITEPGGSHADYSFDATGRLTSITGAGLGTSQYLSSAKYRAWGGLKSLAYGNSTTLALSYNNRAQLTEYSLNGVRAQASGPIQAEGGSFQYYADSRIKFASDLRTNATASGLHDRAYSFDHAGRLTEAYSGSEARDFLNGSGAGVALGAFRQSFNYDPWSNLTSRTGRFWSEVDSAIDSYNQNRNAAWDYDAAGRLLSHNEPAPNQLPYEPLRFTYDASGRRIQATQMTGRVSEDPVEPIFLATTVTNGETYDGDGRRVKTIRTEQVNTSAPTTRTVYFLYSSLTGNVIGEYDAVGVCQKTYVSVGGEIIAEGQRQPDGTTRVIWQHVNPVTGDGLSTDSQAVALGRTNIDPMGVNVGDADPFISNQPTNGGDGEGMSQSSIDAMVASLIPGWGGPQVKMDGFITSPRVAFSMLARGAATLGPSQTTTGIYNLSGTYVGVAFYNPQAAARGVALFGQGSLGFLPAGSSITSVQDRGDAIVFPGWFTSLSEYQFGPRNFLSVNSAGILSAIWAAGGEYSMNTSQEPLRSNRMPCEYMARNAQHLADSITSAYPNMDPSKQIEAFNQRFSRWYIGDYIGHSYASAAGFFKRNLSTNFKGGDLSDMYKGAEDFPDKFKDNEGGEINLGADQTHHFVAYLSAGLNNQRAAAALHMRADSSAGNTGDVALGNVGYGMGRYIVADRVRLNHIGGYIRKYVCNGETPPFALLR